MLFSRCCASCITSFERHLLYLPSRTPQRPKTQDHIRTVSTKRFMRNFDASLTTVLNRRSSRTPSSLKKTTPSSSSTSTSRYINHVGSDTTNYISNTDSLSEDTGKGTSSNRKPPVITPSVVGQHSSKGPRSIQNIDAESSISSPHHRILHSQVEEPEEGYWLSFRPGVELTKSVEDKFDDWFAKNIWEEGKLSSWAKEMRVVRGQSNKVLIQWHSLDDCKRAKIVYNPYRRLMHCDFQASLWPLDDYYTSTLEIFGLSELDEVESVRNQFPYLSGSKETQIKGWEGGGSKKFALLECANNEELLLAIKRGPLGTFQRRHWALTGSLCRPKLLEDIKKEATSQADFRVRLLNIHDQMFPPSDYEKLPEM